MRKAARNGHAPAVKEMPEEEQRRREREERVHRIPRMLMGMLEGHLGNEQREGGGNEEEH